MVKFIQLIEGKRISVAHYYYGLTELGWKYNLEESDLFNSLSKTFWSDGIKVLLNLTEFRSVPPDEYETSTIKDLRFYSFDIQIHKKRDIYNLFEIMLKDEFNAWKTAEEYITHLEKNYPHYISNADFNTGIDPNDNRFLKKIDPNKVPVHILQNVELDIQKLNQSKIINKME